MEAMAVRGSDKDFTLLLLLLDDENENEVIRSWGAQHVGMSLHKMGSAQEAQAVRKLMSVADNVAYPRLIRREAVYALAGHARQSTEVMQFMEKYLANHIGLANNQDIDNDLRALGLCKIRGYKPQLETFAKSKKPQIAGAAKEALKLIPENKE